MAVPSDPRHALGAYRTGATRLAEALFSIDTDPEFELLNDKGGFRGQSATLAADARTRVEHLWLLYPLLKEALDRLETAIGVNDHVERGRLLGRSAVVLPDGSATSLAGLLTGLERDLEQATTVARRLGTVWSTLMPHVERLRTSLQRLTEQAADIGLADDGDLAMARRLVQHLTDNAASDPLAADPGPAQQAIDRAADRVNGLLRQRDGLPDALADARGQLESLAQLIAEGRDALAVTQAKVADPKGLLRPLEADIIDGDERSLGPWLARLEDLAGKGDWRPAVAGLARWKAVADGWVTNARKVAEANRTPLERRNELRGRLAGYRAKAAAQGRAEDPTLAELYQQAHALLHNAPADIDAGATRVREYERAVNQTSGTRP